MFSPLEQFDILKLFLLTSNTFILTNSFLVLLLLVLLISLIFTFNVNYNYIIPRPYQRFLEQVILFVKSLISENLSPLYYKYFRYLFFLFLLVLGSNLLGMIPYTFTVTSHLIVTLCLSFISFWGLNVIGLLHHGSNFSLLFLPAGSPLIMAPFLILIEVTSYLARVFSLAIRLFANLMSGHTLLKILSGFGWTLLNLKGFWVVLSFMALSIVFLVTGLEIVIAMLQAYVFTILVTIYMNDAFSLH